MGLKSIWTICFIFFLSFSAFGFTGEQPKPAGLPEAADSHKVQPAKTNLSPDTALESKSAPKIVIEKPRFNFGSVVEGEKVVHEFTILNKGTAPLNIQKVKTG